MIKKTFKRLGIFLEEALDLKLARGSVTEDDVEAATIDGAVHRLRPKLMTVAVVILSLAPIFFETGIGNDVMKPIAVPIVGGVVTSTIAVLILLPVLFAILKQRALRKGTLKLSVVGTLQSTAGVMTDPVIRMEAIDDREC